MKDPTPSDFAHYIRENRNFSTFNPEEELQYFHYWESYDELKIFTPEIFLGNFGLGEKYYNCGLFTFVDKYNPTNQLHFVVTNELLSPEEINLLADYCECKKCSSNWWKNLLSYLYCPCCVGCIKSCGFNPIKTKYIHLAREKLLE